jgi:hypothetical protein
MPHKKNREANARIGIRFPEDFIFYPLKHLHLNNSRRANPELGPADKTPSPAKAMPRQGLSNP